MNKRSKQIRRDSIKLAQQYGGTHFGGSMSCVEILAVLYDEVLTKDDTFILSKGHSCWPYYVLLREKGYSPNIECHPHIDIHNGIHCTTGSLGHGLPVGLGIALGKKLKKESGTVYVLMGDGECQEGTLWESLLIANAKGIDNITVIVDYNHMQGSQHTYRIVKLPDLSAIAMTCGWNTQTVTNGHDKDHLLYAFNTISNSAPSFILVNTIKGKGVSFMENKSEWHSKPLLPDLEQKAMEELK